MHIYTHIYVDVYLFIYTCERRMNVYVLYISTHIHKCMCIYTLVESNTHM